MHPSAISPESVIPCPGSAPSRLLPRFLLLGVGALAGILTACSGDKPKPGADTSAAPTAPAPASVTSAGGAPIAAPAPAPVTDPSAALANAMSTPARAAETF